MQQTILRLFAVCLGVTAINANLCTDANKQTVGRVVFGEARGESTQGQLAAAFTVVNRISHAGYPSTLHDVVYDTYNNGKNYQYNTLDSADHDKAWAKAKVDDNSEYTSAITAASGALCGTKTDPTECATDFCAKKNCPALKANKYFDVYCKGTECPQKIGNHYFVCRKAK